MKKKLNKSKAITKVKKLVLFLSTPMNAETKTHLIELFPILADGRKISIREFWIFSLILLGILNFIGGCSENDSSKAPVQAEQQQTKTEVPAIKIVNNRLFVDDKEMPAKDFVEKYCFSKRDDSTCIEVSILRNIQQTLQGGEKPKVW